MKKHLLIVAALLLPGLAIAQKTDSIFRLNVRINNPKAPARLYLAYQTDGKKIIDSAMREPKKNLYTFSGISTEPLHATLVADHDNIGLQGLMKRSQTSTTVDLIKIYLHHGMINMTTTDSVSQGIFKGSPINADDQLLQAQLRSVTNQEMTVSIKFRNNRDVKISRQLASQLDSLHLLRRPILKKFYEEHPQSYIALMALGEYAGSKPKMATFGPQFSKLGASVRNSEQGRRFYKLMVDLATLKAGVPAPDFTQKDTAGRNVSLSAYKGKFVLLDFWASWCGPCRDQNPKIVKVYHEFKDRDFTILGVSLDGADGREAWLKAIKDDKLEWTQVSDLKHWDNEVSKLYSVSSIPQNYLIGPDGVIVARDLGPEELRKKLQEILPVK